MTDDIGTRFKRYEAVSDFELPRRLPMVIRVDGRAFHGLELVKPFDADFSDAMQTVACQLCENIQGAVFAYMQSDEVSVIARDDQTLVSEPWFGKRLSKVNSVSAAIATETFNLFNFHGHFDARAFVLPDLTEAVNYLIWRQQDAVRNSIQMAARAVFSHKECQNRKTPELIELLCKAGRPYHDLPYRFRVGSAIREQTFTHKNAQTGETKPCKGWMVMDETPRFKDIPERVKQYLEPVCED